MKRGSSEVKRCRKTSVAGEVSEDEGGSPCCGGSGTPRRGGKESKKRRGESPPTNPPTQDSPASWGKKAKMPKDNNNIKAIWLTCIVESFYFLPSSFNFIRIPTLVQLK